MKKRIRLLKAWEYKSHGQEVSHKIGTILEVEETEFKSLTEDGSAEEYTADMEAAEKAANEASTKSAEDFAKKFLASTLDEIGKKQGNPLIGITVKDKSDDDPGHGYLPERIGNNWTADEKRFGFGLFVSDVMTEGESQGRTVPERLTKSRARSAQVIKDGAKFMAGDAAKAATMTANTGQDAGFLIPPEINTSLLGLIEEQSTIRPRATKISCSTGSVDLPYTEDYDRSSDVLYGGVQTYFKAEQAQLTASKPKQGMISLKLNALTALGFLTDQAIRFTPISLGEFMFQRFAGAVAWKEDLVFQEGTGAGMPLGFRVGNSYISVAKEGSQTLNTIVAENVTKVYARCVMRGAAGSLVWIANQTCLPQMFTLKDNAGNAIFLAGQGNGNLAMGPQMTLLGVPLEYNEKAAIVGDVGDLTLCNLSDYIIADDTQGPALATSGHLRFDYNEEALKYTKYVDAQPAQKKAYTPKKGDTLSHYVTIAARD